MVNGQEVKTTNGSCSPNGTDIKKQQEDAAKLKATLPDLQRTVDDRGISINRVGVEDIDFLLTITNKQGDKIPVQAKIDMFTSLRHQVKGINMSRFLDVLMEWKDEVLTDQGVEKLLRQLWEKMGPKDVEDTYIKIKFKYFLHKMTPVSKLDCVVAHDCFFIGVLRNNNFHMNVGAEVLVTTNCPCSKAISKYGAHGQRSRCTVIIRELLKKRFWLEDLIALIEKQGSCEIYPLLKRVDEKYVTEKAYENPKFVEDVSRDIAIALQETNLIRKFRIKVKNEESIHHHDATAYVARKLWGSTWVKDQAFGII